MTADSDTLAATIREALQDGIEYHGHELDDVTGRVHALTPQAQKYERAIAALDALLASVAALERENGRLALEAATADADWKRALRERDRSRDELVLRLRETEQLERELDQARDALAFRDVAAQNAARARRWHPGFPEDDEWNGADWSNAMCGEAGEAANVVKKLRRHETGHHGALDGDEQELRAKLAHELADVILYADLLATKYGITLADAVVEKFNIVSERQGFPERLGAAALGGAAE